MKACYVCQSNIGFDEHHVIPQAKGGRAGPTVFLCPTHHDLVHRVSSAKIANRPADELTASLSFNENKRLQALVKGILLAHATRQEMKNPNPMLAVRLRDPKYLVALHKFKIESGFTSIDAAVNAMLHVMAKKYGLL